MTRQHSHLLHPFTLSPCHNRRAATLFSDSIHHKLGRCPIAILQLIDQLADALNRGRPIPLSSLRVIDANEFAQLIERMRISVPSSIMESERTLAQRDHILAEAQAEAERMVQQAKQRAMEIISQEAVMQTALHYAERIIEERRSAAHRLAA